MRHYYDDHSSDYYHSYHPHQDPPGKHRRRRPLVVFAIFLVGLVAVSGVSAALMWRDGHPLFSDSPPWSYGFHFDYGYHDPRNPYDIPSEDGDAFWDDGASSAPTQSPFEAPAIYMDRAASGDGTVLPLSPRPAAPLTYQEIYAKASPAIVYLYAQGPSSAGSGTGVIFTEDGYLLTNAHVIEGAEAVEVSLEDGRHYSARLVGWDRDTDLAVLKMDGADLPCAEFGDSDLLQVGDPALAIGNPLGEELRGTMTDGIISAINRDVKVDGRTMVLLQTSAALNSGNSGGALLNEYGQVVGITTLKMSSWREPIEGLGFAIPSSSAKMIADELIAQGHLSDRPTLGIVVLELSAQLAAEYDCPVGLRIEYVDPAATQAARRLAVGDVILQVDGQPITTAAELQALRDDHGIGDNLSLVIWRDGEEFPTAIPVLDRYVLE